MTYTVTDVQEFTGTNSVFLKSDGTAFALMDDDFKNGRSHVVTIRVAGDLAPILTAVDQPALNNTQSIGQAVLLAAGDKSTRWIDVSGAYPDDQQPLWFKFVSADNEFWVADTLAGREVAE